MICKDKDNKITKKNMNMAKNTDMNIMILKKMISLKNIRIGTSRPYDVHIERGGLKKSGELISAVLNSKKAVIITDDTVDKLYSDTLRESLENRVFPLIFLFFPTVNNQRILKLSVQFTIVFATTVSQEAISSLPLAAELLAILRDLPQLLF
jgi:hypothetical protein